MIAIIRQDADIRAGDPAKVADLVESKILPHFNFTRMTQIAVARGWALATPEQKKSLTEEFRPLRAARADTEVTVRSLADKNRQGDARFRSHRTGDFYVPAVLVHAANRQSS